MLSKLYCVNEGVGQITFSYKIELYPNLEYLTLAFHFLICLIRLIILNS